jgi:membrane protein YqaA with SNARE-associated domain
LTPAAARGMGGGMETTLALSGLFAVAFLAATVVPLGSEPVFLGLQVLGTAPLWLLVAVAGTGNTLGSFVNYWLGAQADRPWVARRLRLDPARMDRARGWWGRWGVWTLLVSWAPLGDALTVLAGAMRTPLWQFAALVALAKTGRYAVLGLAAAGLVG